MATKAGSKAKPFAKAERGFNSSTGMASFDNLKLCPDASGDIEVTARCGEASVAVLLRGILSKEPKSMPCPSSRHTTS